ncbi:agmatine deiminase family protein [Oceanirhabdus seepicola]|uniref:Agmatine deiminase family protein n=1 Tax=Oceanirhabdus seepicola TaxID=2828781 RepID=A0A9J6NWA1_9CLOT|nr:agmatine deiminase family protein [Oceanirhabdus seepicola]MCM1988340.1 agmatine deiminase family protein [Oceanirhabdus seepicola]
MKKIMVLSIGAIFILFVLVGCIHHNENLSEGNYDKKEKKNNIMGKYTMPDEKEEHEGTWLQWPHDKTYGEGYKESVESIWIEMASELSKGENVHIIVYDEFEKEHVYNIINDHSLDMEKIDFYVYPTDDVWVRDNGPIFVYDNKQNLKMMDWGFNGWGEKTPYKNDILIPSILSKDLGIERVELHNVVLEGGAIELDGNGSVLSTRSAVTNSNRNPDLTEEEIEEYLREYYGVSNFIWLDGVAGIDITDFHIDGFAKFFDGYTIITLKEEDLIEWGVSDKDIEILMNAKNAEGKLYEYIYLPLSKNNVVLENGKDLGYKGSYANYYIGNSVVLVPNYNDPNDNIANEIIQELYPKRKVVGIDVRELYQYGGMIHCVTQQQPVKLK